MTTPTAGRFLFVLETRSSFVSVYLTVTGTKFRRQAEPASEAALGPRGEWGPRPEQRPQVGRGRLSGE